jgi:dolichyl-phosphate mannosyltransferase polypeptide 3
LAPQHFTTFTTTITALSLTTLQLPFWALISFGAYLLFKLGWGVFTFNDVPDAHKELMQQIAEARKDLQAKGVDVGED